MAPETAPVFREMLAVIDPGPPVLRSNQENHSPGTAGPSSKVLKRLINSGRKLAA
jgi:hypothetical protein